MEIRSGFDGLSSLLGVNTTDTVAGRGKSHAAGAGGIGSEDHATLSSAASQMAQTSGEDGVRTEKVAAIQKALADGSYSVPASDVAAKVIDSMLAGSR